MSIRRVRPVRFPKRARLSARQLARRSAAARHKRRRVHHLPWREAICLRCNAPIAIGEQIGRAEIPYIVAHLRGCTVGVIRANGKPSVSQVFEHIRVRVA
jgi:hypothetical protein